MANRRDETLAVLQQLGLSRDEAEEELSYREAEAARLLEEADESTRAEAAKEARAHLFASTPFYIVPRRRPASAPSIELPKPPSNGTSMPVAEKPSIAAATAAPSETKWEAASAPPPPRVEEAAIAPAARATTAPSVLATPSTAAAVETLIPQPVVPTPEAVAPAVALPVEPVASLVVESVSAAPEEPPVAVAAPPAEVAVAAQREVEAAPTPKAEAPAQLAAITAPTRVVEMPTRVVEMPTRVVEMPTRVVEMPTPVEPPAAMEPVVAVEVTKAAELVAIAEPAAVVEAPKSVESPAPVEAAAPVDAPKAAAAPSVVEPVAAVEAPRAAEAVVAVEPPVQAATPTIEAPALAAAEPAIVEAAVEAPEAEKATETSTGGDVAASLDEPAVPVELPLAAVVETVPIEPEIETEKGPKPPRVSRKRRREMAAALAAEEAAKNPKAARGEPAGIFAPVVRYRRWTTSGPKWHLGLGLAAPIVALLVAIAIFGAVDGWYSSDSGSETARTAVADPALSNRAYTSYVLAMQSMLSVYGTSLDTITRVANQPTATNPGWANQLNGAALAMLSAGDSMRKVGVPLCVAASHHNLMVGVTNMDNGANDILTGVASSNADDLTKATDLINAGKPILVQASQEIQSTKC